MYLPPPGSAVVNFSRAALVKDFTAAAGDRVVLDLIQLSALLEGLTICHSPLAYGLCEN